MTEDDFDSERNKFVVGSVSSVTHASNTHFYTRYTMSGLQMFRWWRDVVIMFLHLISFVCSLQRTGTEYTWAATTHWFIRMNLMHNFRYTFVLLRQDAFFLVNMLLDRNTKLATNLAWKYSILIENNQL